MPRRLLVLLLVGWLSLSACLPAPTPPVLKIGLVAPFEGRYRSVGYDAVYAARLAVREINAAGGVGGYALALVAFDDGGTVEGAEAAARALLVDEAVVAVLGHYRPLSSAAAQPLYGEGGLPFLSIGALLPTAAGTWQLMPSPTAFAEALVEATGKEGMVALWAEGDTPLRRAVASRLAEAGLGPARETEARGIISLLPPVQTGERLVAVRLPAVGTTSLLADDFAAVAGKAAQGTVIITPYPLPRDVAGTERWREAYVGIGPHVPEPGPYALPTYEAVYLVAAAIESAARQGEVDRASVAAALPAVVREGYLGRIAWDVDGRWCAPRLYRYRWMASGPRLDLP